eukprot:m.32835 g.32835  ORF g.32835 m.32835 type:complete len:185 (+) comp9425_c0_seq1:23-577(+)
MSLWQRFMDWLRSLFFNEEMEVTLVGLESSGKTTFVRVLTSGQFAEDTQPTIGFNMRKITKGNVTIKMWDMGGQKRFQGMWERYCRGVNCIVYMVDAAKPDLFPAAKEGLLTLLSKEQLAGIPLLVLGNKNDLPEAVPVDDLILAMDLKSITDREVCCYAVSCKNQTNLDITLQWLTKHSKGKS